MLCVIMVLVNILMLSGCSSSNGVLDSQVKEDIKGLKELKECFKSEFVYDSTYEYVSHKTIKRQTNLEKKEDILFCEIV